MTLLTSSMTNFRSSSASIVGRRYVDGHLLAVAVAVVAEAAAGRRSVVGVGADGAAVDGRGHHHHGRLPVGIRGGIEGRRRRWWWWWRRKRSGRRIGSHGGTAGLWRWRRRRRWRRVRRIRDICLAAGLPLEGLQGAGRDTGVEEATDKVVDHAEGSTLALGYIVRPEGVHRGVQGSRS